MSVLAGYLPKRCGVNQILHYCQLIHTGHFQHFDFGTVGNLEHYGNPTPPQYNLDNVVVKVAIYYGQTDNLLLS